jgi:hypothetical protein
LVGLESEIGSEERELVIQTRGWLFDDAVDGPLRGHSLGRDGSCILCRELARLLFGIVHSKRVQDSWTERRGRREGGGEASDL